MSVLGLDIGTTGCKAVVFAPGVVSHPGRYEYALSIPPDGDRLLFTSFTARVGVNGAERRLAINDPAFLSPFTCLRLTSFGYAPVYMLVMEGVDRPLEEGAVKLNVFPPGTRDSFKTRHFPHVFHVTLWPDFVHTADGLGAPRAAPRFDAQSPKTYRAIDDENPVER